MQLKKIIFFSITFFCLNHINAQKLNVEWLEETYNFGTLNEKGGESNHRFYFINKGRDAVKIQTAKASCGCTTPSWFSKPVFSGDTGFVEARYNPDNRPGNFNKTITVFFENSEHINKEITITGFVQPEITNAFKKYPEKVGNMRFDNKFLL